MIVLTIAFVSCFSWLRSGIERYADRKLSPCCQFIVSGFVGLLTDLFMCRGFSLAQTHCFSLLSEPWQPFQWPVFTARKFLCTENNTLEIQLLSEFCHPLCTLWFIGCRRREEIPSVSGILTRFPCSANKNACPIGFWRLDGKSCLPRLSGSRICHKSHAIQFFNTCAWFSARKKTSPARLSAKQKKSWFSSIFYFRGGLCTRKNYLFS